MRIESVSLENVKSYGNGSTEVPLGSGINAILGSNGAGKSTVLEAVGFAIFDYLNPYTQEDFRRDGADEGCVRVKISMDGETFTVERYLGKPTYRVLEGGQEVATQKQNVIPWIRDKLGIPGSLELDKLWVASIGVPQGQLTTDFTKPPRERRRSFDPVLRTAAYTDAWENMREVEKVLETEASELEKEIEGLKAKAEGIEEKIDERDGMEERLRKLRKTEAEAEEELSAAKDEEKELEKVKNSVEALRSTISAKDSKIEAIRDTLEEAEGLVAEVEEAKRVLDETGQAYREYEVKEGEKEHLEKKMKGKEDLVNSLSELNKRLARFETKKENLSKAVATAQKAKERMKDLREGVSHQKKVEERLSGLKAEAKKQDESISLLRKTEDPKCPTCSQPLPENVKESVLNKHKREKAELEEEVAKLEAELEGLGSPKEEMEMAKTRYQDNQEAEDELAGVVERIENLQEEKRELESSLEEYGDLGSKLDSLEERLSELEDFHEKYVRNEGSASKLDERRKRAKEVRERLEGLQEERKELTSKLNREEERFDEERYREVSSKVRGLTSKLSELGARIEERESGLAKLNDEIKEMREAREKLVEKREKKDELRKDLEFEVFVREGIKQAQPLITEILVEKISETASGIFRQLRGESQSLTWTKDYQVVVQDGKKEKAFYKLSGGEQVCAALAVRLAILQRLAPVNFAFLDEPTENLDDERRQNLASHLERFEALDQLCVISHDRVFESMADQVVSLEKRDGATRASPF